MRVTNISGQTLGFPCGTEVKRGESYTLTEDDLKNAGVKEFIDDGWLEDAKGNPAKVKTGE